MGQAVAVLTDYTAGEVRRVLSLQEIRLRRGVDLKAAPFLPLGGPILRGLL